MKKLLFSLLLVLSFCIVLVAKADNYSQISESFDQLEAARTGAGYGEAVDPRLIAANAIKLALAFIGTILFALNVYSGYLWMTAGGNEEKVAQAKTTIRNSTIGLIIILAAYGITIAATNLALGRNVGSGANRGTTLDEAVERAWFR